MRNNTGFSLIEICIALAIFSSFVLLFSQWQTQQHRAQLLEYSVETLLEISQLARRYFANHQTFPETAASLGIEEWKTPWNQGYELASEGNNLQVISNYPDEQKARQIAARLPNSTSQGRQVVSTIVAPATQLVSPFALYRVDMPGAPELNRMEVDLDMNRHSLQGVYRVDAENLRAQNATIDVITAEQFTTQSLRVEGDLSTNELIAESAEIESIRAERLTSDFAEIRQLTAQSVQIDAMEVEELSAEHASIEHAEIQTVNTQRLEAEFMQASDFQAGHVRFSDLQQQLALLQAEWDACVAQGGCR